MITKGQIVHKLKGSHLIHNIIIMDKFDNPAYFDDYPPSEAESGFSRPFTFNCGPSFYDFLSSINCNNFCPMSSPPVWGRPQYRNNVQIPTGVHDYYNVMWDPRIRRGNPTAELSDNCLANNGQCRWPMSGQKMTLKREKCPIRPKSCNYPRVSAATGQKVKKFVSKGMPKYSAKLAENEQKNPSPDDLEILADDYEDNFDEFDDFPKSGGKPSQYVQVDLCNEFEQVVKPYMEQLIGQIIHQSIIELSIEEDQYEQFKRRRNFKKMIDEERALLEKMRDKICHENKQENIDECCTEIAKGFVQDEMEKAMEICSSDFNYDKCEDLQDQSLKLECCEEIAKEFVQKEIEKATICAEEENGEANRLTTSEAEHKLCEQLAQKFVQEEIEEAAEICRKNP